MATVSRAWPPEKRCSPAELAGEVGNIDQFIVPPALGDHAGVLAAIDLPMTAHRGLAK